MAVERKRGQALETAILESASEILETAGYEKMTFQNVAKRAKTSRTVIYERYAHKFELLYALAQYRFAQSHGGNMIDFVQEQGSLRDDLLAVLELYQRFAETVGPELMSAILFERSQGNEHFRQLAARGQESNMEIMRKVQAWARRRGEIRSELSVLQMSLPFDLLRFENMLRGETVTRAYLIQLVDEVLLPIYRR